MSHTKVTIVDYGVGNLKSVRRAFEHAGSDVVISDNPTVVAKADRLVLPGVGAFGHCMNELDARGLTGAVHEFVASGMPFLGICVGMQIMLTIGDEFGEHKGLNLIPGRVKKISAPKLPYIGWAALQKPAHSPDWKGTALADIREGEQVYFLHSYAAACDDASRNLATYDYNGVPVCAAIVRDQLTGVQFHPEKSAGVGMRIIKRFLAL